MSNIKQLNIIPSKHHNNPNLITLKTKNNNNNLRTITVTKIIIILKINLKYLKTIK
jgi:hypothetical protein